MKKLAGPSIIRGGNLTQANATYYMEKGFLVAESLLSSAEILEIRNETVQIFKGNRGNVDGIVSIKEKATETEILAKYNAIHFPHKLSDVILKYLKHPKISGILKNIISQNVKCMQSMLFVKGPGKPGQSWHQDEYYIPTRDRSLTGAWMALDDAVIENGCLWVIPASHRDGILRRILPFENNEYAEQFSCDLSPFIEEDAVPVQISKGSVLFFNGYLLHRSLRNRSGSNFRMALVSHYMSAESLLPWNWDGRIELKEDMRDILMITGKDPYDFKGIESITYPYLRSDSGASAARENDNETY